MTDTEEKMEWLVMGMVVWGCCLKVVFKLYSSCLQVVSNLFPSCLKSISKLSQVDEEQWLVVGMVVRGRPQGCLQVFPSGWGAVVGFEGGSLRAGLWPRAGSSDHATLNIPSSWVLCSDTPPIPTLVIRDTLLFYPIPALRYSALLLCSPHSFNYSDLLLPTW